MCLREIFRVQCQRKQLDSSNLGFFMVRALFSMDRALRLPGKAGTSWAPQFCEPL